MMGNVPLEQIVRSFLTALRLRDESAYRHSKKVMYYSLQIAQKLGLEDGQTELLKWASLLHDIGTLVESDHVFNANGKPKSKHLNLVRRHQPLAVEILSTIAEMKEIMPIIKSHHERYDGTGYPDGLCGEEIPLLSRIVTMADAYEIMTRIGLNNTPLSHMQACFELKQNAGIQFDPNMVEVFLRYLRLDKNHLVSIFIMENDIEHFYLLFKLIEDLDHIKMGRGYNQSIINEAISKEEYDLILADISLPWTDGFELLRYIKSEFPSVRVALMSAYTNLEMRKKAENLGAFAYLEKPVRRDEIFDVVDRIAEEKIVF
jgi:putative nucleotidyltransferase with HDIG domain